MFSCPCTFINSSLIDFWSRSSGKLSTSKKGYSKLVAWDRKWINLWVLYCLHWVWNSESDLFWYLVLQISKNSCSPWWYFITLIKCYISNSSLANTYHLEHDATQHSIFCSSFETPSYFSECSKMKSNSTIRS
jgi:hypothetical protein